MPDLSELIKSLTGQQAMTTPAAPPSPMPLPNGGLEGPALQSYLTKNPIPAPIVGSNPMIAPQAASTAPMMPAVSPKPMAPTAPALTPNQLLELGKIYQSKKTNPTPNEIPLSRSIASLIGSPSEEELKKAQDHEKFMRFLASMQQAGDGINAAFTPLAKHDQMDKTYESALADAHLPVQHLQEREALAKESLAKQHLQQQAANEIAMNDPNSIKSQEYRKVAGITDKNVPASAIEKLTPILAKKDASEDRKQVRLDEQSMKYSKAMGEDLDPSRARSGEMGKNQARVNAADRIDTLLKQFPDGNIPKIQTRELATSVANLLSSGSQSAVSQVNELVPHTLKGNSAGIAEWITGNPQGAQQQEFIKLYADTAAREKATAVHQIQDAQVRKAYSTHAKLKSLDPDAFYSNLSAATGLDVDDIKTMEKKKGFKGQLIDKEEPKKEMQAHHQDDEAVKWAKANPKDPRSEAILKANGL